MSNSSNARIEKAKALAAGVVNAPKDDAQAKAAFELLKRAKMPHPYKAGKMISQMYVGEVFPVLGITLADWLAATYVPNDVHQAALDELAELRAANKKAVTTKKK